MSDTMGGTSFAVKAPPKKLSYAERAREKARALSASASKASAAAASSASKSMSASSKSLSASSKSMFSSMAAARRRRAEPEVRLDVFNEEAEAADAPPPPALLARPPSDDVIDAPAVLEIPGRARPPGVVGGLCAWPPPVDARRELLAASVVAAGLAARFAALRLLGERGDDVDGDAYYPPAWVQ